MAGTESSADLFGRRMADLFGRRIDVGSFTLALIGVFAVVGIRLLSVANWDSGVLRAEIAGLSLQGLPALVISIASTDIRDTTILLVSIAAYLYVGAVASPPREQRWAVACAVLLALLSTRANLVHYAKSTFSTIIIGGISLAVIWVLTPLFIRSESFNVSLALVKGAAVLVAFSSAANIATQGAPWVPEEDVVTAQATTRGWVIGENSNSQWLRILTDGKPRKVVLVRIGDVTRRSIVSQ